MGQVRQLGIKHFAKGTTCWLQFNSIHLFKFPVLISITFSSPPCCPVVNVQNYHDYLFIKIFTYTSTEITATLVPTNEQYLADKKADKKVLLSIHWFIHSSVMIFPALNFHDNHCLGENMCKSQKNTIKLKLVDQYSRLQWAPAGWKIDQIW